MQAFSHLTLNLVAPNAALVSYAVQNDRLSRYVVAELANGEQAFAPPSGTLYAIRYRKPDGTGGFYDTLEDGTPAVTANGSTLTIGYAQQVLTVPGDVFVMLQLLNGSGQVLTSFSWRLLVFENVWNDDQIESSDYYSILSEQIAAVLDAAENLTGMTASATSLPAGSEPTARVTGGSGGNPYNLELGIPAGQTGPAPTLGQTEVQYQASTSGTTVPTGTWQSSPPTVNPGSYLWTRARAQFGGNWTSYWYSVSYRGLNGSGSPSSAVPLIATGSGAVGTSTDFARADHRHPSPVYCIVFAGVSSFPKTGTNAKIAANMRVVEMEIGNPRALRSPVSWNIDDGVITLDGEFASGETTDIFVYMAVI